jgi:hypothetical protein
MNWEKRQGWHKPNIHGGVQQKIYGVKVGHVVHKRIGIRTHMWVALFDGTFLGNFDDEHEAKVAVDMAAAEWMDRTRVWTVPGEQC